MGMPRDDLEALRHSIDGYNRGDVDAFLETWSREAVLDWSNSNGFEAGVYRGHVAIGAFVKQFRDAFEEVRIELIGDPVEVREGLWLAENVTYLRGRDGIEVQARSTWLITFSHGEQTSLTLYQTKADALEAAEPHG
jgi:hypothetical protein